MQAIAMSSELETVGASEYDTASLYMVSCYCFVTESCAKKPGTAASQAFERMHIL